MKCNIHSSTQNSGGKISIACLALQQIKNSFPLNGKQKLYLRLIVTKKHLISRLNIHFPKASWIVQSKLLFQVMKC